MSTTAERHQQRLERFKRLYCEPGTASLKWSLCRRWKAHPTLRMNFTNTSRWVIVLVFGYAGPERVVVARRLRAWMCRVARMELDSLTPTRSDFWVNFM